MLEKNTNKINTKVGEGLAPKQLTASFIQEVERLEKQVLAVEASGRDKSQDEMISLLLMLDELELKFQQLMLIKKYAAVRRC